MSIKITSVFVIVCCIAQTLSMVLPGGQMPGGFSGCEETITQDHTNVANFALSSMNNGYTLDEIVCVKQQIVNGINYDMEIRVNAGPACKKTCNVEVFHGPFGPAMQMNLDQYRCSNNCNAPVIQ